MREVYFSIVLVGLGLDDDDVLSCLGVGGVYLALRRNSNALGWALSVAFVCVSSCFDFGGGRLSVKRGVGGQYAVWMS